MSASQRKKKARGGKAAGDAAAAQPDATAAQPEATATAEAAPAAAEEVSPEETIAQLREQILRAQADLQNIRRRSDQEVEERVRRRLEGWLFDLIRVADYMEAALGAIPEGVRQAEQADAFLAGIQAIHQALEGVMRGHGIEILSPGPETEFDPELHEAVESVVEEGLEQNRLELMARGYRLGRTILRPAKVKLLTPPEKAGD